MSLHGTYVPGVSVPHTTSQVRFPCVLRLFDGACFCFSLQYQRACVSRYYILSTVLAQVSENKEGSIATNTFRGLHGAFIVADITRQETFHGVAKFRQIIDEKVTIDSSNAKRCTCGRLGNFFFGQRCGVDAGGLAYPGAVFVYLISTESSSQKLCTAM